MPRPNEAITNEQATHFVIGCEPGIVYVKDAWFFKEQGGITGSWGEYWRPVIAKTIGDARREGAKLFNITLSPIYNGEK